MNMLEKSVAEAMAEAKKRNDALREAVLGHTPAMLRAIQAIDYSRIYQNPHVFLEQEAKEQRERISTCLKGLSSTVSIAVSNQKMYSDSIIKAAKRLESDRESYSQIVSNLENAILKPAQNLEKAITGYGKISEKLIHSASHLSEELGLSFITEVRNPSNPFMLDLESIRPYIDKYNSSLIRDTMQQDYGLNVGVPAVDASYMSISMMMVQHQNLKVSEAILAKLEQISDKLDKRG